VRIFRAEVRRRRARLQLTQAALADRLGWETGVYTIPEPTARLLQRIGKMGRCEKVHHVERELIRWCLSPAR
jgi:hypothetical protein